jgi:glycosyltransferase involved in cell wall biosynthesis
MSLRVLAVGHDAGRQGAPRVMLDMLDWFRGNSDLRFEVILHMGGPLLDEFQKVAPTTVMNPYLGSPQFMARMSRILVPNPQKLDRILAMRHRRRIRNLRCGVVWMNSVASWKAAEAVAPRGVPRVLHVHELAGIIRQVGPPGGSISTMADHFVAASGAVRKQLVDRHGVALRDIALVYSAVSAKRTPPPDPQVRLQERSRNGIGPDDLVLAACGVGNAAKGFDLVGQLLAKLRHRGDLPPVHLIWVGRVESEANASLSIDLERMGLAKTVHLVGEVDDPRRVFNLGDIFVLPSREESLSLVVLEAAQCCLPTVCFADAGGAPEFVGSDAGRVVPYLDLDALAASVAELALDPQLRSRLGKQARRKVRERFTVEKQGPKLLEVFKRTVTGGTGGVYSDDGAARRR